ncbi:MAG: hypothetical protein LKE46_16985 [Clostridium sp.]|uniref:hypothetical protein n=1 Tax=Clostridium sp. TaxID=1506 RepID=UPI0025C1DDD6|nr:hypothetical protein [Clostridium sp.]MCH3965912.1 hypothetical protein [Clostridium sp.]MCI1715999.1 hypothetical protein [Clostridium sp.]MCI1800329.1 hypothetical protein [Clostridium sp.]MCI1814176.1 hypothetical protein [Clostridium sp.]MCI1871075.1 hypothetical protein [Clostridium sp.]
MNNFLNKLSYYFRDCYGVDKLSKHLYIIGFILSIFRSRGSSTFGFVCIVYSTWRCLSKNKYKRHHELQSYENFIAPLERMFSGFKTSSNQRRYYKIFKCPNCSQKMRVPRHKGKITITCRNCGTSFKGKS